MTKIPKEILKIDIRTMGREAFRLSCEPRINFFAMKNDVFKSFGYWGQKYTLLHLFLFGLLFFPLQGHAEIRHAVHKDATSKVFTQPGANQIKNHLPKLSSKRVGIVANQTSVLTEGNAVKMHLVDYLLDKQVDVRLVFSPEHGFRGQGDAGEKISSTKDEITGLPIVSLYGNNKKPKKEQLDSIDLIVFDLQDVGVRFYTYISTLHYVMQACAESKIPIIVLDRPNPNIHIVDGPVLKKGFESFIGMHQVPLLYGMTIGEYALMIRGEQWVDSSVQLEVLPCVNYNRKSPYELPVPPSPNLRTKQAIQWYASLCLFEGTVVSVGRGTDRPFEQIGHPLYPIKSYSFTPRPGLGSKDPLLNGKQCFGVDYADSTFQDKLHLEPILSFYRLFPEKANFFLKNKFFNLLAGNDELRSQIEQGKTEQEIRDTWRFDLERFLQIRKPYLIYAEE
jgi:uncharacterized protein YbbC (DUF1343 family)